MIQTKYKFLSFYSMVIILPLVLLGCTCYFVASKIISNKNETIYNSMLLKTQNAIEIKINSFNNLTASLQNNRRLQKVLYENQNFPLSQMAGNLDYYYAISELKQSAFYYDHIESVALYINDSKAFLHPEGIYDSSDFLNTVFPEKSADFPTFLAGCSELNKNYFYLLPQNITINFKQSDIFTIIRTFSATGTDFDGAFMIFVRTSLFDELLSSSYHENTYFVLVDENDNIIGGNKEIAKYAQSNSGNYSVYHKSFEHLPWKLYLYVPSGSAQYSYGYVKWFLTVFIIFTLLGLILAVAISYGSYKPVRKIINILLPKHMQKNSTVALTSNEYNFIKASLTSMKQQTEELKKISALYEASIMELYTAKLVTGSHLKKNEMIPILNSLHIGLKNMSFLVCCVSVNICRDPAADDSYSEKEIFTRIFSSVKSGIDVMGGMENSGTYYIDGPEGENTLLFYWETVNPVYDKIINILNNSKAIGCYSESIKIHFGAGSVVEYASDIYKSYMNATASLSYAKLLDLQGVVPFSEIAGMKIEPFYYPLELETDILRALKNKNHEKIHHIMNTLLIKNLEERTLDPISAQGLYFKIYSTMKKGVNSLDVNDMASICSIKAMIGYTDNVYKRLCCDEMEKTDQSNETANKILTYIDDNFLNADISLNQLAAMFYVTPQYISKIFRSDTEAGFLDYVNTKRIRYAVSLLESTDYPVEQISRLSGFSNPYTFIRVFKRYKRVTPGSYRQN